MYATGTARFFDMSGAVYACELGRLASELIALSEGALCRRLECCYDEILIDEVQDLAAHDWEILDFLLRSTCSVTMVGDFRQAVLSTNPRSAKNKPYTQVGALEWFRERERQGRLILVEHNHSWRCRPEIAAFSDRIYATTGLFSPTVAKNESATGHDGVFWVHPEHATAYVQRFAPQCLRDSVKSGKEHRFAYLNFGEAKGTSYTRVLIVPTAPIAGFVKKGQDLKPKSAAKFYVAVTRAAQSVAIILDEPGDSMLPRWQPTG